MSTCFLVYLSPGGTHDHRQTRLHPRRHGRAGREQPADHPAHHGLARRRVDGRRRQTRAELLHQQLPGAGEPPQDEGGREGRGGRLGRRAGRGALDRRHAGAAHRAGAPAGRVQGGRGRALRAERLLRQPGRHRAAGRQGGRDLLRPAEPRLDHRRRAAQRRQDRRLRALRPGRPGSEDPGAPAQLPPRADGDGRRLQHGRRRRAAGSS